MAIECLCVYGTLSACLFSWDFMAVVPMHIADWQPGRHHIYEWDDVCHICVKYFKSTFIDTGISS